MFRAAMWATGTQILRFSTGANEIIDGELDGTETDESGPEMVQKAEFDLSKDDPSDTVDGSPFEPVDGQWSIEGVGRVDDSGEAIHDLNRTGVEYVEIDDAQHLDPPDPQPPDTPQPRTTETALTDY
jgi:hypothetical protein